MLPRRARVLATDAIIFAAPQSQPLQAATPELHAFPCGGREPRQPVAGAFVKVAADGVLRGEGVTDARGVFEVKGSFDGRVAAVAHKEGSYALASD